MNVATASVSKRSRPLVLWALLAVVVLELLLAFALRYAGWNETLSSAAWLGAAIVAAVPLLIALAAFSWSGRRFGLRTLLVGITLLAVFLSVSLSPVFRYTSARAAHARLLAAGIETGTTKQILDFDSAGSEQEFSAQPLEIRWLRPLVERYRTIGPDSEVQYVEVSSDDELQVLISQLHRLPNLYHVALVGDVKSPLSDESLRTLASAKKSLSALTVDGSVSSSKGLDALRLFDQLEYVALWHISSPSPDFLPDSLRTLFVRAEGSTRRNVLAREHLTEIGELPNLKTVFLSGLYLTDDDVLPLRRLVGLRHLFLHNTLAGPKAERILQEALPDCNVQRSRHRHREEFMEREFSLSPEKAVRSVFGSVQERLLQLMIPAGLDTRQSADVWCHSELPTMLDRLRSDGYLTEQHVSGFLLVLCKRAGNGPDLFPEPVTEWGVWMEAGQEILIGLDRAIDDDFEVADG